MDRGAHDDQSRRRSVAHQSGGQHPRHEAMVRAEPPGSASVVGILGRAGCQPVRLTSPARCRSGAREARSRRRPALRDSWWAARRARICQATRRHHDRPPPIGQGERLRAVTRSARGVVEVALDEATSGDDVAGRSVLPRHDVEMREAFAPMHLEAAVDTAQRGDALLGTSRHHAWREPSQLGAVQIPIDWPKAL
jgi:hypothetical protein